MAAGTGPMSTSVVRPSMNLPYNGVAKAPQAGTAITPPPTLQTMPQVSFPYGAVAGDQRPY